MTVPDADWDRWSTLWQADPAPVHASPAWADRARAEDRRLQLMVVAEGAVVVVALAGIALAVSHAPAPDDLLRGAVVAGMIVLVATLRLLRRPDAHAEAEPAAVFLAHSLRGLARQRHCVQSIWLLLALTLLFLVPWWVDGYRFHGEVWGPLALFTAWVPLALIFAVAAWTLRVHATVRRETARLRRLRRELVADDTGPPFP